MITARIGVQHTGRIYLTINVDGIELFHEQVASRAIAEMKINALEEARKEQVHVTVETNL